MSQNTNEIMNITKQFIETCSPVRMILFGSQAKKNARRNSDIDICVVVETKSKRDLLTDMYCTIVSELPFDVLLYTPDEWEKCYNDNTSFAYQINKKGIRLYG